MAIIRTAATNPAQVRRKIRQTTGNPLLLQMKRGGAAAGAAAGAGAGTKLKPKPKPSPWSKGNPYAGMIAQYQSGIPTTKSLLGTARKAVQAELAPALETLRQNSLVEQRQLSNQSTRAQEFAKALGAINLAQGAQLAEGYRDTSRFFGTLGSGLTGQVAQDWAAKTAAAQEAVNQMTGGLAGATVQPGYSQPGLASTAQYTGVTLPAADLAQQALTAQAGLQAQSAADVMGVGNIANQYLAKLADERSELNAERAKLTAQRPGLVQGALEGLRTDREAKLGNVIKLLGGAGDWETVQKELRLKQLQEAREARSSRVYDQYLQDQIGLKKQEMTLAEQEQANQLEIDRYNAVTDRQKAQWEESVKRAGMFVNPYTGSIEKIPAGHIIGPKGLPIDPSPSRGTTGKRGTTTARITGEDRRQLRTDMTEALTKQLGIIPGVTTGAKWSKARIAKWLNANYADDFLADYPGQRKLLQQMINKIATQYGVKAKAIDRNAGAPPGPLGPTGPPPAR